MGKKVMVIGGTGGREHALSWKLSQSPKVEKVYLAPGNGGTGNTGENVDISPSKTDGLIDFCKEKDVDLVVIGPDDLLADGLCDEFQKNGFAVFGPSKKAARIESSKAFAKNLMKKQGVPTADYEVFTDAEKALDYARNHQYPLVVKASGLALGKGVLICDDFESAQNAINSIMVDKVFKSAGETIVIEDFMQGSEVSFHVLSDGTNRVMFPPSQDHKQVFDGDKGPNTGGMGVFGPVSWISAELADTVDKNIVEPILEGLKEEKSTFAGCLYPGLMITKDGPKVVEYNSRFGDPETQIYMRLMESDLYDLLYACATGSLKPDMLKWKPGFAVSVVLASGGYPESYEKGIEITGCEEAEAMEDIVLFHAGTRMEDGRLLTSGGRVMNVTATGDTLDEAIAKAYKAVEKIHFDKMHYRTDIGRREIPHFQ